jgi:2-polyprenyl-3-methyl-5-hydroxy-6-metoxy-1,4-benzoquinol methylase
VAESGFDVVGIERSSNAIGYASMLVPRARFFAGDVRDKRFLMSFPEKFDDVALIEVIEHIPPKDSVSALQGMSSVSGIPSFLNGQDFDVFPRFGPTRSAQIG